MNKKRIVIIFLLACSFVWMTVDKSYSEIGSSVAKHILFTISRSMNANVVAYTANVDSAGGLDSEKPVDAFWIMHEKNGQRETLSFLEEYAYGFDLLNTDSADGRLSNKKVRQRIEFLIKSFTERKITVIAENARRVYALMKINGRKAVLNKIFVKLKPGINFSAVEYLELFGKSLASGKRLYEKIAVP